MKNSVKTRVNLCLLALAACASLSACDWVDSTGAQSVDVPQTELFLDDVPIGGAIPLPENEPSRITANRDTGAIVEQSFQWSETALEQGNLAVCEVVEGYSSELAAESLSEACTDSANCSISFERVDSDDGVADFNVNVPMLRASVGLRYALTVSDTSGRSDVRELDFCLIASNDEPIARDDTFVVLEGAREVFTTNELNLLSNDSDDDDVSNTEFRVLPTPAVEPSSAAFFELGEDGSFTYESDALALTTDLFDSFDYQLSDGVNVSQATVTIRIVASNQAPQQIDDIPLLVATEGEFFVENLALFFIDPEEGNLSFSFEDSAVLPDAGTLALNSAGLLAGRPAAADVGNYVLTMLISDGGREISSVITFQVVPAPIVPENTAPVYIEDTVFSQTISLGDPILDIVPEFIDPDGDLLTYSIADNDELPEGVEIDEDTGIVFGTPEELIWVRGLRIEATDPAGESDLSDAFFIRVR